MNFFNEYESLKNGNITEFKRFLSTLTAQEIYDFIKWLQSEGLTI
jgi:hypothetical protein